MIPGTTRLHVRSSTTTNDHDGVDTTASLPIGVVTSVKIETYGRLMRVSFNGTEVARHVFGANRYYGPAQLYVSDNWYPAANAAFGNLRLEQLDYLFLNGISLREMSHLSELRELQAEYYGQVIVPENYTLTFDVKPLGVHSHWGSILHYTMVTKDNVGRQQRRCKGPNPSYLDDSRYHQTSCAQQYYHKCK